MAITALMYGNCPKQAFNKEIDFDSDTIKVTLHTSTYTPDQDVHDYQNDLTNELSTASGYTSGGATLASKTVTYTAGTNVFMMDAADVTWTAFSATFRTAVVVDTTPGTTATNPVLCYQQNSADISPGGADLTLQWNAAGIMTITVT